MRIRGKEHSKIQVVWSACFVLACILLASCSPAQPTLSSATAPTTTKVSTTTPMPTPKPTPTKQTRYPVCNTLVTNTPCVEYASVQEAAAGESSVSAEVSTSMSGNIVKIKSDLTYASSSEVTLDAIQFQCFNIQQALWYINSTINADGSQTIRKSPFTEVDITFINQSTAFASCRLTSATVDKIDKAGMWTDGDYVGAWAMYDSKSFA
jgi:hypothetical protein